MRWLTIDYIKQHSRLDYDVEDSLLELYADAAEDHVLDDMNTTYEKMIDEYGQVPNKVLLASLMLVDAWYEHRSPVSPVNMSVVPYTYDLLIKPYMTL